MNGSDQSVEVMAVKTYKKICPLKKQKRLLLFLDYSTVLCLIPSVEEDFPAKQTHAQNWSAFDKHACFVKRIYIFFQW